VPTIGDSSLDNFKALTNRYPGNCVLEFELYQHTDYAVHVIPSQAVKINPVPAFVEEVEALFGENSCILEIPR
jgi:hypothetical protein